MIYSIQSEACSFHLHPKLELVPPVRFVCASHVINIKILSTAQVHDDNQRMFFFGKV